MSLSHEWSECYRNVSDKDKKKSCVGRKLLFSMLGKDAGTEAVNNSIHICTDTVVAKSIKDTNLKLQCNIITGKLQLLTLRAI